MGVEIERKFLVKDNTFKTVAFKKEYIKQGYLNSHKERAVRVRIKNDEGFLTIKGKSNKSGTTRFEWEQKISKKDAQKLFNICEEGIIEKHRYYVKIYQHTFEVDEFLGDNKGLILAEVELNDENEHFEKPNWLSNEVTGNPKYYNSNLINNPFLNW